MTDCAISFATRASLEDWLARNGDSETELWVHIHKVGSGQDSIRWEDCVVAALAYGWIDGIKKSLGPDAYLQRLTPRKKRSGWSKRNCELARGLIADGAMQPAGLAEVEAAQADGRWDAAYAGSSALTIPDDFMIALAASPRARQTFDTLDRRNLFVIYYRLHTAKTPQTRARRLAALVATLDSGKRFHD